MQTVQNKRAAAPLKLYSLSLAPTDAAVLATLAQAASEQLGRDISTSAVLRVILRSIGKRILSEPALIDTLEAELQAGCMEGTTKR
jgi:hypothetical protein